MFLKLKMSEKFSCVENVYIKNFWKFLKFFFYSSTPIWQSLSLHIFLQLLLLLWLQCYYYYCLMDQHTIFTTYSNLWTLTLYSQLYSSCVQTHSHMHTYIRTYIHIHRPAHVHIHILPNGMKLLKLKSMPLNVSILHTYICLPSLCSPKLMASIATLIRK